MRRRARPDRKRPRLTLLVAFVVALAAAAAPSGVVLACSCAFPGYIEAIASADVAFIGTVVGEEEPAGFDERPMPEARYAFSIARSKAPMTSPFELGVVFGNGANCGFDMSLGEEYVVIASVWEGRLMSNLCHGTTLTESLEEVDLLAIEGALPIREAAREPHESSWLEVPAPLAAAVGVVLLIGLVSVLAFRRGYARNG